MFPAYAGMIPEHKGPPEYDAVVFPAYAGMIPIFWLDHFILQSVPRIRGDDPLYLHETDNSGACSPHTRG